MRLATLRRFLPTLESLERRDTPSTIAPHTHHPLRVIHGTIQLTPDASMTHTASNGNTIFSGTATVSSPKLGTITGTFQEEIGPRHLHGAAQLTLSGGGLTAKIYLTENYFNRQGNSAKTHGTVNLKVNGPLVAAHSLGVDNGTTDVVAGTANLTFTGLIRV
jgi:hypothetical protein